jgi:hypothetical protein
MTPQLHNLGYLRMAVEDVLVAHLSSLVTSARVRAAYTTDQIERPVVTVHAGQTRERNEQDYNLARYVDVEIRCLTYAEKTDLQTAREAHFQLVADVYHALANGGIVTALNEVGGARVKFWSCYAKTDTGTMLEQSHLTIISVEIGATPQEN